MGWSRATHPRTARATRSAKRIDRSRPERGRGGRVKTQRTHLRTGCALVAAAFVAFAVASSGAAAPIESDAAAPIEVTLSVTDAGTPFPHFWEVMFGSERAAVSLRDSYRKDLRQ